MWQGWFVTLGTHKLYYVDSRQQAVLRLDELMQGMVEIRIAIIRDGYKTHEKLLRENKPTDYRTSFS